MQIILFSTKSGPSENCEAIFSPQGHSLGDSMRRVLNVPNYLTLLIAVTPCHIPCYFSMETDSLLHYE